ncbi:MAG: hypothetical protein FH762_20120 [Firmicutes bacterium]|nr:hypothetical protein [Bacillota bacterium]
MKIRAHHIKKGLADKHTDEFFMTEVKNGPTWSARKGELLQLDGLAIKKSWTRPSGKYQLSRLWNEPGTRKNI